MINNPAITATGVIREPASMNLGCKKRLYGCKRVALPLLHFEGPRHDRVSVCWEWRSNSACSRKLARHFHGGSPPVHCRRAVPKHAAADEGQHSHAELESPPRLPSSECPNVPPGATDQPG